MRRSTRIVLLIVAGAVLLAAAGAAGYFYWKKKNPSVREVAMRVLGDPELMKRCKNKCSPLPDDPVCIGGINMPAPNKCFAECAGVPYTKGKCATTPCGCDMTAADDTCAMGRDLPKCVSDCWGLEYKPLTCHQVRCGCTNVSDPVCMNKATYQNECMARCAAADAKLSKFGWTGGSCPVEPVDDKPRPIRNRTPPPPPFKPFIYNPSATAAPSTRSA